MRFRKMHGLGNDFVILDQKDISGTLTADQIRHICDRHFGVGCDLLTVLEPSDKADIFARFYNADGSESGACGNATRCVADLVMNELQVTRCKIQLAYGVLECCRADNGMITVDMGPPLSVEDIDLPDIRLPTSNLQPPTSVNMGNPHCVFFVSNIEDIDVETVGHAVENHAAFPDKTNVEFVEIISGTKLRQVTWERGCGITLACGSGACATAVAASYRNLMDGHKVEIELDGGTLFIEIHEDGHILMTGPVAYVFDGMLKP
ncbi:MAG: diaminopimelate epimerase [Bdellovibrionales bacterium]